MARIVLHTENAVGSYDGVPNSFPTEASLATALKVRGSSPRISFVYTGMDVSAGAGLSVDISSGTACIEGFIIQLTASANLAGLDPSDTLYIWAALSRDGNGLVDDFDLEFTTTTGWDDEHVLLGRCTTGVATVTSTESAVKTPNIDDGTYAGNGTTKTIWLGMTPRFVNVSKASLADGPWQSVPAADSTSLVTIVTYGFSATGAANGLATYYYSAFF